MAPPYLFSSGAVGLMQIAAVIGFAVGTFGGGWLADVITAKRILEHNGHISPEHRLWALLPGCCIGSIGCIIIAIACSKKLHWSAIAIGFGLRKDYDLPSEKSTDVDSLIRNSFCTKNCDHICCRELS